MKEYLVIKLGVMRNIDFYAAHKEILDKNGYVDFARVGRYRIFLHDDTSKTIFIKESELNRGRLFRATIGGLNIKGEIYPDYYRMIDLSKAQWIRLTSLEEISVDDFMNDYCLRNGNDAVGLKRGTASLIHVIKRQDFVNARN